MLWSSSPILHNSSKSIRTHVFFAKNSRKSIRTPLFFSKTRERERLDRETRERDTRDRIGEDDHNIWDGS